MTIMGLSRSCSTVEARTNGALHQLKPPGILVPPTPKHHLRRVRYNDVSEIQ